MITGLLFSVLITACNSETLNSSEGGSKTLNFSGESKHWSGEVSVIQTGKRQDKHIILKYKGGDVRKIKTISYKIEGIDGGVSASQVKLNKSGVLDTSGGSSTGGGLLSKNDKLTVTVKWNGNSETFNLVSK
ncbi:MAG: hypothetical protein K6T72_15375 [Anoxybacillus sp.]|nr:hypothetical protein [Anoxybacillus sp.]MCL6587860.1 hypothetical protein [Anoxybacillus sp.]